MNQKMVNTKDRKKIQLYDSKLMEPWNSNNDNEEGKMGTRVILKGKRFGLG